MEDDTEHACPCLLGLSASSFCAFHCSSPCALTGLGSVPVDLLPAIHARVLLCALQDSPATKGARQESQLILLDTMTACLEHQWDVKVRPGSNEWGLEKIHDACS